jgi:hypothetical protein
MAFIVILLDIAIFIYQQTVFRLYKVSILKRSDYIILDRKKLAYLNFVQKTSCIYCSYVN